MVNHTQADELFVCIWPFCGVRAYRVKREKLIGLKKKTWKVVSLFSVFIKGVYRTLLKIYEESFIFVKRLRLRCFKGLAYKQKQENTLSVPVDIANSLETSADVLHIANSLEVLADAS